MTSIFYLTLVVPFVYLPFVGFAQDNSTSVWEGRSFSNLKMTSINLTNVSTTCLRISDSAIENILRLMHIHTTNVVEIEVSIDSRNKTRIFKWPWASEIGRTIISLITHPTLVVSSWQLSTLTRGIVKAQVVVSEENYGCLQAGSSGSDRVFDFLLHQLSRAEDAHDYDHKLCRAHNNENDVKQLNCCRVANDGKLLICADYSSIVLEYADHYLTVMKYIIFGIFLPLLLKYLRSFLEESDSYEITYSPMALSSIFHTLFFYGSCNSVKSCYRRLAFSLTVAVVCFISNSSTTWFWIVAFIWVLPFTAFDVFGINIVLTEEIDKDHMYNIYLVALTLPFNLKYWWNLFESKCCNCNPQQESDGQQPTNPQQPMTCKETACKFLKGLFFVLLYLSGLVVTIPLSLALATGVATIAVLNPNMTKYMDGVDVVKLSRTLVPHLYCILASLIFILISIDFFLKLMLFFIAGLYLNVEFYGPIAVPVFGLIVYSWKHWRSFVETEYLQLKTKIYDICQKLWENPPTDSNTDPERIYLEFPVNATDGKVPKALYEKVREKNSPYHKVLFNFFARMFFVANFFLVVAVMMLLAQESGISGSARIMSTLIVSSFPFFFDSVLAEHTSQQADANDKKLELQLSKIIHFKSKADHIITVALEKEENSTDQLHNIMDVFKFFPILPRFQAIVSCSL